MLWRPLLSICLALAAAALSAVHAKVECTRNEDQGQADIGTYIAPKSKTGVSPFYTTGADYYDEPDAVYIWVYDCTSVYMNIRASNQTALPQVTYGLLVIVSGQDLPLNLNKQRCIGVQFDEGTTTEGTLVAQPCSFLDDESQLTQTWINWGTDTPFNFYHKFLGRPPNGTFPSVYDYGRAYNFEYEHDKGSLVRVKYSKRSHYGSLFLEDVG